MFEPGSPIHIAMADPFSNPLREVLIAAAIDLGCRFTHPEPSSPLKGPGFYARRIGNVRNMGATSLT